MLSVVYNYVCQNGVRSIVLIILWTLLLEILMEMPRVWILYMDTDLAYMYISYTALILGKTGVVPFALKIILQYFFMPCEKL